MADVAAVRAWMERRAVADDRLYERYGKPLEAKHKGEYVAISDDGHVIMGTDKVAVAMQAASKFGAGTFALRCIGKAVDLHLRQARE